MAVATPPVEEKIQPYRPSSPRPKSPHVTIYRWPITMAMSIAHRATGAALYAGTVLLVIYLAALAMGEQSFHYVQAIYLSPVGEFILFLYTLALVHHMVGGIRHLFWDVRPGLMEKHCATKTAWATIGISLIVTIFIWFVACTFF
ncbi:MAG: succinate dehydrogenase, cytochrome b556 subunit [Candidatus Tokpelaia sp.]|nr:MAG: succinate dehydrogenase, cytochrome b556 subunit [Candidatus Tokpelaia sp.]KAA6206777.1 MAG: succinate dehydrogenase, cytochrome b556 subunit [Candidatus Tokpelaia sp.]